MLGESEFVHHLEQLLWSSRTLAFARFASDGTLRQANDRFLSLVGRSMEGQSLADLVVQGQRGEIVSLLRDRDPSEAPRNLHLARGEQMPTTLLATWVWEGDDLVLLGETPIADLEASQEMLVKLNSRVSELMRENTKKSALLEKALADLREAQAMLVHREKMAALGQMTAGVAHELNNPLAYIKNNHYLLRRGVEDLMGLVNLFGESLAVIERGEPDLVETILDHMEHIDLPHLSESIPRLLASLDSGVDRATGLIERLRTFSRLDESDVKTADVNESLRSVVEFAGLLMRENDTRFVADYGDVPAVTCSIGQVNQAVLNILTNAVHAAGEGGRVALTTRAIPGSVVIEVSDNGPGVPEDLSERIFEPFFTTKPVGQGTGLGLSIAHTVIEEHGGSIEVVSRPGEGATFIVRLPLEKGGGA